MSEFARLLVQGAAAVGLPSPTPEAVESLGRYAMELDKWNRRVNLVSRAPLAKIVEVHFLDSLTLLPVLAAHGWRAGQALLDVGSGAGFPGLALKAACPSMPVTLVEPREKRACFLRHVVRVLGLSGVRVLDERLDDGGRFAAVHGRYTWITSRALTSLPRFLRLVEGVCAPSGFVCCMKGRRAADEVTAWRTADVSSRFRLVERHAFALPESGAAREIVVFQEAGP